MAFALVLMRMGRRTRCLIQTANEKYNPNIDILTITFISCGSLTYTFIQVGMEGSHPRPRDGSLDLSVPFLPPSILALNLSPHNTAVSHPGPRKRLNSAPEFGHDLSTNILLPHLDLLYGEQARLVARVRGGEQRAYVRKSAMFSRVSG